VSVCEAMTVMKASGIDLATTYEAIRISSGTSFVHETESQLILSGSRDVNFTMDLVQKDIGLFQKLADDNRVPLEISPLLIEIMSDGQRRYGERAQSDRIIERLEEATGLSIRADGFPDILVDDEPEEEGYEVVRAAMNADRFYIGGNGSRPAGMRPCRSWIHPWTNRSAPSRLGNLPDVNRAVQAAVEAFEAFGRWPKADRLALLKRIREVTQARLEDLAQAMSLEMGAPITMAREMQAEAGVGHADGFIEALEAQDERWTLPNGDTLLREPIGPVGPHHAVELADQPDRAQGPAGACDRMSRDPEAVRTHAAFGPDLRGNPA
jgi:hypothetical protein